MDEVNSRYSVLEAVQDTLVNVDQLDYLAKRLDGFCAGEVSEFEAMAHKLELTDIKDFINLTFCCQQATVITDFSDLEKIGRDHMMTLSGGAMPMDQYQAVDGRKAALQLLQGGNGTVTPFGVAYDNGMELKPVYNGHQFPVYPYDGLFMVLELLRGALALEQAKNLDDVLRVADGLDQYEIFPRIKTDEDLGHFLVDTAPVTGKFSFPEETRPYLDYAKIGAEQRNALGGMHTTNGFIKRREEVPVQVETPRAMFLTLTVSDRSYPLVLPAAEGQLDHAKRALGIEDFSQAAIASTEYVEPFLNQLIPVDCITVENATGMALCLQRIKAEGGMSKYCAALEVEEPSTFMEALDLAMDIDDYELVSGSEQEYARKALRRIGADDELLDTIDGYTDFDSLGRAMMEEDGVRQTGFGLVRRLSKPFPEPEIGQAMM